MPTFRAARDSDAEAVRALVFAALAEHGLSPDPEGTDRDLYDLEAAYRRGWFEVLEDDGRLVGSVALLPHGEGTLELRKMYLAKGARGRGWGRLLLERALAEARRRGAAKVSLETASVLKDAIALYERYGFSRVDAPKESARCDLVMVLSLEPRG